MNRSTQLKDEQESPGVVYTPFAIRGQIEISGRTKSLSGGRNYMLFLLFHQVKELINRQGFVYFIRNRAVLERVDHAFDPGVLIWKFRNDKILSA